MTVAFQKTIPILRIFDVEKAKEFYVGFLGFTVAWEHHMVIGIRKGNTIGFKRETP